MDPKFIIQKVFYLFNESLAFSSKPHFDRVYFTKSYKENYNDAGEKYQKEIAPIKSFGMIIRITHKLVLELNRFKLINFDINIHYRPIIILIYNHLAYMYYADIHRLILI